LSWLPLLPWVGRGKLAGPRAAVTDTEGYACPAVSATRLNGILDTVGMQVVRTWRAMKLPP